ncbi:MAG: D-alanine--D-alanine ligase [Akkermansiaceae bacterium]|nr:D-alanine--D-alanine ligase [Armatimonadota bacterium]
MTKLKIAVLCGGTSAEREVSLNTGRQVLNSLDPERYDVYALDTASGKMFVPDAIAGGVTPQLLMTAGEEPVTALAELPRLPVAARPDVVFIALHGPGGEDGSVQGFLETLGIPYTGSGILASALAMDKMRYKAFIGTESIVTPPGMVFYKNDAAQNRRAIGDVGRNLGFPVIVKPSRQGSTYGCSVVKEEGYLKSALDKAFRYDDTALVEQQMIGTEITVAVLGNDDPIPLPVVEIVSKDGFFDYESKYSTGESGATEIVPARISEEATKDAQNIAVQCHRLLGCRGMSRTDMFVLDDDEIVTLETNTIPGMTATSLLPKAAQAGGIGFPDLLNHLIKLAREK